MTTYDATTDQIDPRVLAGFGAVLLAVALPMAGLRLWVGLTEFRRWSWTDLVLILVVLAASAWMLRTRVGSRPVVVTLLLTSSVMVAGQAYDVAFAFAQPQVDDYLSSEIYLGGMFVTLVAALIGLIIALLPPRWAPPHRL